MALRLQRRLYARKWRADHIDWVRVDRAMRKYGMTLDQYHAMYESQDFACAICQDADASLLVDHDHDSGKPRALLCVRCNTGIGMFLESQALFAKASEYVTKHQAVQ